MLRCVHQLLHAQSFDYSYSKIWRVGVCAVFMVRVVRALSFLLVFACVSLVCVRVGAGGGGRTKVNIYGHVIARRGFECRRTRACFLLYRPTHAEACLRTPTHATRKPLRSIRVAASAYACLLMLTHACEHL